VEDWREAKTLAKNPRDLRKKKKTKRKRSVNAVAKIRIGKEKKEGLNKHVLRRRRRRKKSLFQGAVVLPRWGVLKGTAIAGGSGKKSK